MLQWRYSKRDPTPPTSPTTWYVRITLSTPQPADLTLGYCRAQIGPVAASSWMPLLPPSLSHVCGSVATYMRRKIPIDPDDLTSILMTSLRIPTHPPRIPTHPLVVTTQTTFPLPPFQAHLDLGPSHTRQGYGFETVQFGGPCVPPTLVVNAANANPGRASHLCQGPIRVDLAPLADPAPSGLAQSDPRSAGGADGALALGEEEAAAAAAAAAGRRLLAVDLGLRSGFAMFDGSGALLSYTQHHFADEASMCAAAEEALRSCGGDGGGSGDEGGDSATESQSGGGVGEGGAVDSPEVAAAAAAAAAAAVGVTPRVTHMAIEGRDMGLRLAWEAAAARVAEADGVSPAVMLDVTPEARQREPNLRPASAGPKPAPSTLISTCRALVRCASRCPSRCASRHSRDLLIT